MPEGDTIFRAAANLRKVLDGRRIETAIARPEVGDIQSLRGAMVSSVEARGKHLIIHFDHRIVLHSHMGMTGSWHIYPLGHPWKKPESQAVVTLKTDRYCVVCFTPKQIRIMTERELLRDPYLQRLGPDILGPPIENDVLIARFRSQRHRPIGETLLNQTVVSGIGNVYKSELLFCEGIHPLTPTVTLSDDDLFKLRDLAAFLLRRNLENGPRRTRFRGDEQKLWVYGRRGEPCLKCDATVELIRQGDLARSTYYCPTCQPREP